MLIAAYVNAGHAFSEGILLDALQDQPEKLQKPSEGNANVTAMDVGDFMDFSGVVSTEEVKNEPFPDMLMSPQQQPMITSPQQQPPMMSPAQSMTSPQHPPLSSPQSTPHDCTSLLLHQP